MNPSLQEIENSLFEKLRNLNCVPIKNVLAIEPDISLKSIILDQSYLQEKLNVFIWMLFKVEPTFAPDFVDSDYFSIDVKSKKIIDSLTCLGLVDPTDFNKLKLLNTTSKNFKEILLILDDLGKLLPKRIVTNMDDFSFDLSMTSSFLSNAPSAKIEEIDDLFEKKIQIFDDINFFNEYRSIIQSGSYSSLIPSDLSRIIKNINTNSTYFDSIQIGKITKSELLPSLKVYLENLNTKIEQNQAILKSSNTDDFNLVQLEENSDKFAERNANFKQYLEELTSCLISFQEISKDVVNDCEPQSEILSSLNEFKPESSLEQNFENFYNLINDYKKIGNFYKNWSVFINQQNEKISEYQKNCSFFKNNYIQTFFAQNEIFNKQIEECLKCFGNNIF